MDGIRERNRRKSLALRKLLGVSGPKYKNKAVPYRVYFVPRNFKHVLHSVVESVAASEKERLAHEFQRRYVNDLGGFAEFMQSRNVAVAGDYAETRGVVRKGGGQFCCTAGLTLIFCLRNQKCNDALMSRNCRQVFASCRR